MPGVTSTREINVLDEILGNESEDDSVPETADEQLDSSVPSDTPVDTVDDGDVAAVHCHCHCSCRLYFHFSNALRRLYTVFIVLYGRPASAFTCLSLESHTYTYRYSCTRSSTMYYSNSRYSRARSIHS